MRWSVFTCVHEHASSMRAQKRVSSWNSSRLGGGRAGSKELSSASVPQDTLQLSPRGNEKQSEPHAFSLDLPLPLITELSSGSSTEKDRLRWAAASMSQPKHRAGVHAAGLCIQWPDINTVVLKHMSSACFYIDWDRAKVLPCCSDTMCRKKTA